MKIEKRNEVLFNEFIIEKELGRGGMGKVYLVRSQTTGRNFAVKEALVKDDASRRAFIDELQTWIDIPYHPNILACRFFRTVGDETLIFADYAEGGSLADWIAQGKLQTLEQKIDVAIQFASGLHAIHECGLVHQDVKPGNVLMTKEGIPKVADFGLARAKQHMAVAHGLNRPSATFGDTLFVSSGGMTPAYASPEQREGKALSSKTDIWSWAVSVLDIFVGEPSCPFGGHIAGDTLNDIVTEAENDGLEQIPTDVAEVLRGCFEHDPNKRWPNLGAVVDCLCSVYQVATGQPYSKVVRSETTGGETELSKTSHSQYSRSPEEWLAYANQLRGKTPRITARVTATARGSLVEAIRMMNEVVPVMERFMDDAVGHSIQRYFDAIYVSADLHRRLSDESGCLSKLKSAIQTLQRRNMTQIDVRLVLGDALHTYAVALREFKHLEEAAVSVREALRLFPPAIPKSEHPYQTARYLQTLGTILTEQGDHSRALPVFQEAVELLDQRNEPDAPHMLSLALNNAGLCARKCGLNDLAISAYQGCIHIRESIMRSQPEDWSIQDQTAGTLSNLSSVLCDLGRREEALEAIDKALAYRWMLIRKNPEPELRVSLAKARHNRAAVLYQMERWVEAVKEYADAIETLMPLLEMEGRSDLRSLVKSATSSQDSALQRIEEWDVKKADQMYAELIPGERRAMKELTSQWRSAVLSRMLSNWAGLKRTLTQPGSAWLLLEEAIRCIDNIEPNLPLPETTESLIICHRNLGVLLAGMHAFNKAENICAKGREYCLEFGRVGKDPVFTDNYCDLSLCLARSMAAQGKTDQAAAILGELSSLSFEINGLKTTRASMQKAINEIQRHFNSCVDERNDPQLGYYSKCIAFEAQSQRQEEDLVGAARLYEKALDLNQYDETLWTNLSVIYAKLKDYHRAMRGCDRALALNSRNGATWLNRGLFCFELQRFADAAASFDKAYELGIIDAGAKAEYCHDIVAGRI